MKKLRWLLLGLYLVAVLLLLVTAVLRINEIGWLIFAAFTLVTQALFIFIPGRIDYLTPTRARRLIVPAIVGALMMAVLVCALLVALAELFRIDGPDWVAALILVVTGTSWIVWTVVFFTHARRMEPYRWVKRMVVWLLAGSLLQLLSTVPSHVIVSRRPGCFVGLSTALGVFGGLFVMCWAFGPGIALLFWAETRKRMAGHCIGCGYNLRGLTERICPECGRPFTFAEVRVTAEELEFAGKIED